MEIKKYTNANVSAELMAKKGRGNGCPFLFSTTLLITWDDNIPAEPASIISALVNPFVCPVAIETTTIKKDTQHRPSIPHVTP